MTNHFAGIPRFPYQPVYTGMLDQTIKTTRLLSAREVATQCGVTAETVKAWIRYKGLPAIQLPGAFRIDPIDLEQWLDSQPYFQNGGPK
jgi:excisionase family DNA binding protein